MIASPRGELKPAEVPVPSALVAVPDPAKVETVPWLRERVCAESMATCTTGELAIGVSMPNWLDCSSVTNVAGPVVLEGSTELAPPPAP